MRFATAGNNPPTISAFGNVREIGVVNCRTFTIQCSLLRSKQTYVSREVCPLSGAKQTSDARTAPFRSLGIEQLEHYGRYEGDLFCFDQMLLQKSGA